MYFKRLEIFGFKSFADKTVLHFQPGITAIVGPNGCGKSNVFDAIRWVLGEQSVKELRGSSMEDVIFNGTDKKPALGFAEVSVTFDNESRVLPVDYNEVTVTRRLFRSGESEYCLNKTPVRLKDILEIFMGTGVGAEAYSLVQQGKVDLVVSARPEERRLILDEASGITKYKSRKKEALARLRDTEANLLRLNDIITEVKRQISSLERQANKARRYKEEYEQLKQLELQLARLDFKDLESARQALKAQCSAWSQKESTLASEKDECLRALEQEEEGLRNLEQQLKETQERRIKNEGERAMKEKQISFEEERLRGLDEAEKKLDASQAQLRARIEEHQKRISETQIVRNEVTRQAEEKENALKAKQAGLVRCDEEIQGEEEIIHAEEKKILDFTSRQVGVKNQLTEVMKELQGSLARKRRLDVEENKVAQERREVSQRLSALEARMAACRQDVAQIRGTMEEKMFELKSRREQFKVVNEEMDAFEKEKLFLNSQKEFIETLCVQYDDIPDPVIEGKLTATSKPEEHHSGIIGKVKGVRAVPSRQGFPFLSSGDKTGETYEIDCELKFIELDPIEISKRIEALEEACRKKQAEREIIEKEIETLKPVVGGLEESLQEKEKDYSVLEAQRKDTGQELRKLEEEIQILESEKAETQQTLTVARQREEELTLQLDSFTQQIQTANRFIAEKQTYIERCKKQRETLQLDIVAEESALKAFHEKCQGLCESLRQAEEENRRWHHELLKMDEEREEIGQKRKDYQQAIALLEGALDQLDQEQENLTRHIKDLEAQKGAVEEKAAVIRHRLEDCQRELQELKESVHQEQLQEQEVAFKEKEIKDRLWQTYRIEAAQIEVSSSSEQSSEGETSQSLEPFSEMTRDQLETEAARLRKRCESFGAVNLVAIEEFDELRDRFEFLTKQQSDLIESKQSLHATITKINRQTRQMFLDTFTRVSEEFRIYFRMLFGGGEAQLILLDPDNVLESGIEIVARPPGKKLQNISLLSGGEKSLTAIALIFGVFKVNPSPFCVLDEIDAALDESNVGRFSYLLKDFAKVAQFIVITHNKKTIAAADVFYGVTMQEKGVSRVVSVKFGEEKAPQSSPEPEPAAV